VGRKSEREREREREDRRREGRTAGGNGREGGGSDGRKKMYFCGPFCSYFSHVFHPCPRDLLSVVVKGGRNIKKGRKDRGY
jgi:hypothetical protein